MLDLSDIILFYGTTAWERDSEGNINASAALLADKGRMMHQFQHPSEAGIPPENIIQANFAMSSAEIAEALRDILLAMNMPPSESRNSRIGQATQQLQKAEYRLRLVTRSP